MTDKRKTVCSQNLRTTINVLNIHTVNHRNRKRGSYARYFNRVWAMGCPRMQQFKSSYIIPWVDVCQNITIHFRSIRKFSILHPILNFRITFVRPHSALFHPKSPQLVVTCFMKIIELTSHPSLSVKECGDITTVIITPTVDTTLWLHSPSSLHISYPYMSVTGFLLPNASSIGTCMCAEVVVKQRGCW